MTPTTPEKSKSGVAVRRWLRCGKGLLGVDLTAVDPGRSCGRFGRWQSAGVHQGERSKALLALPEGSEGRAVAEDVAARAIN